MPGLAAAISEAEWIAKIRAAQSLGNHLLAFDLASQAIKEWPNNLVIEHAAILALARAGALGGARERYDALVQSGRLTTIEDRNLAIDFAGLNGRLLKDLAIRSRGKDAAQYQLASARAYEAGYQSLGGYYLAINAATMFLGADLPDLSISNAKIARAEARSADPDYWSVATQAEAAILLGNLDEAASFMRAAGRMGANRLDEIAATRKQLGWIVRRLNLPAEILNNLPGPRIISWFSMPASPDSLNIKKEPSQTVIAFGPLATLPDLLVAKACLDQGVKIHLVLPAGVEHVAEMLDIHADSRTSETFNLVLTHPDTVTTIVTAEGAAFEPAALLMCQQQARGLALLRAANLAVTPEYLGIQENALVIRDLPDDHAGIIRYQQGECPAELVREPHAILFGDVKGFSKLTEFEQLEFLEHIIGGFADVLAEIPAKEYAETAGDGLFIVLSDIIAAVECCFALRDVLPRHVSAAGLPADLGIRLSAHIGPLYKRFDKVIEREKFCGMEVIRTARIEPVTPVGEIFVTEQFAASLAFTTNNAFICEYVGLQPMAKGFGECRMYSLRRVVASS